MQAPEVLETVRLRLRCPRLNDAKVIFDAYARDPAVTRYLVWLSHRSIETTEEFIAHFIDQQAIASAFSYVITRKADAQLLGMIDLRPDRHGANIGYVLAKEYWRQGIMTEAARCIIEYALAQPAIYRVQAFVTWTISPRYVLWKKSACEEKEPYAATLFTLQSQASHEIVTCTPLLSRKPRYASAKNQPRRFLKAMTATQLAGASRNPSSEFFIPQPFHSIQSTKNQQ